MMVTIGGTGDRGPGTGENPGPESVARSTRALTTIQHALLLLFQRWLQGDRLAAQRRRRLLKEPRSA
jgi:hypothetical protein